MADSHLTATSCTDIDTCAQKARGRQEEDSGVYARDFTSGDMNHPRVEGMACPPDRRRMIDQAVKRVVAEYGETLRMLGSNASEES